MALTQQQEKEQQAALHLRQNRRELQQGFREDLMKQDRNIEEDADTPAESQKKNYLNLARRRGAQKIREEAAGLVGAAALSAVSFGLLAFLGRWIGKKWGIAGIVIFMVLSLLLLLIMFIVVLKGMCETYAGQAANALVWTQSFGSTDICAALQ